MHAIGAETVGVDGCDEGVENGGCGCHDTSMRCHGRVLSDGRPRLLANWSRELTCAGSASRAEDHVL
jgi:hypothetical protein